MIHLPLDINTFNFVEREKYDGKFVKYKCGRDFLYYAFHFFLPDVFNQYLNNPEEIERKRLFGRPVPVLCAWTQIQFYSVPAILKKHNLNLRINKKEINTFFDFVTAILFSKIKYNEAVYLMEKSIASRTVVGMDIALRFSGLEDHVMFVYGYDSEYWYIFDTHAVDGLGYEKMMEGEKYYMRISRDEVQRRWKRFSRVWEVSKLHI